MRIPVLAALALMISAATAAAQGVVMPATPSLTMRGEGRVEVAPDHARVTVEVVTKGKSPGAATAAHRERAAQAVDTLRGMQERGVRILQSVFRLDQVRVPPAAERAAPEYQAVTSFELKLSQVNAADRVISSLADSGLFEVRNLRFGIDDKNPGMNAARKNAVDDAVDRARTYAAAAGVQLGPILRIDEADFRSPREFAVAAPMAGSVQVIPPETLTLTASVTITWRITAAVP